MLEMAANTDCERQGGSENQELAEKQIMRLAMRLMFICPAA